MAHGPFVHKPLISLVGNAGIEPAAFGSRGRLPEKPPELKLYSTQQNELITKL